MNNPIYRTPCILKETAQGIQPCLIEDELYNNRQIFLTTDINADTASELLKQLLYLEQQSNTEEIILYINSPGGEVISGLAVYDCMRMMKAPIRTICTGTAASMGAILFLAGDNREMLPHTKIMIHDPSFHGQTATNEKPLEMQKRLQKIMETREILCNIIAERSGSSLEEVFDKTKEDTYFTAKEALEFGLATSLKESLI